MKKQIKSIKLFAIIAMAFVLLIASYNGVYAEDGTAISGMIHERNDTSAIMIGANIILKNTTTGKANDLIVYNKFITNPDVSVENFDTVVNNELGKANDAISSKLLELSNKAEYCKTNYTTPTKNSEENYDESKKYTVSYTKEDGTEGVIVSDTLPDIQGAINTFIVEEDNVAKTGTYTITAEFSYSEHELEKVEATIPTCAKEGNNEYYKCKVCNRAFKDEKATTLTSVEAETLPIDETAHDWDEWKVTKEATEDEEGEMTRVCKNDETHVEIQVIEKLPKQEKEEAPATGDNAIALVGMLTMSLAGIVASKKYIKD